MAWVAITNNTLWQYNNAPANPGVNSPYYPLWQKQVAGIRTRGINQVYVETRKIGTSLTSMGELSKSYWDNQ